MRKDYEKLFTRLKPVEPPTGLFDRIIFAIKREQEIQHTKRVALGFLALFLVSIIATPFSWMVLVKQAENSGIFYFISLAVSDMGVLVLLWQSFILAILESLPVMGIVLFTANIAVVIFTIRLFLHRKKLLLRYLIYGLNLRSALI